MERFRRKPEERVSEKVRERQMELYIIRHGETVWNKEHRLQGRTNIPLSEYGRELAVRTGEALKNVKFDRIYSSPLDRAYETALLIRGDRDIPIEKDERIIELNFGGYEGRVMEELKEDTSTTFQYFFAQPEHYQPDENGETLKHLIERAADFMKDKIEPYENQWERVMIVAHGAMNKALMSYVKGHGIADFWSGGLQKNCNVIIVELVNQKYQVVQEKKIF